MSQTPGMDELLQTTTSDRESKPMSVETSDDKASCLFLERQRMNTSRHCRIELQTSTGVNFMLEVPGPLLALQRGNERIHMMESSSGADFRTIKRV